MTDISTSKPPKNASAVIVLADGSVFYGQGFGAETKTVGEICFNTSMTGYQEILTDPSYAGQIITFTFPHIGNVGTNEEDIEADRPAARGCILREPITDEESWRATGRLDLWLKSYNLPAICGIDTRALTRRIRDLGAPNGVLCHQADGKFDLDALKKEAVEWPGLEGMDLAKEVSCKKAYEWNKPVFGAQSSVIGTPTTDNRSPATPHVVAIDYGAKQNILRCLVSAGCRVSVVPAQTPANEILAMKPDGVFLSNGPGDPAATGTYAVPTIQAILAKNIPLFGICLGHQMLALAIGGQTKKMHQGHRGANQPVKDLTTGKVEITSQNHGFCVVPETLPANAEVTHVSLFDGSNEGLRLKDKPAFSVQYHPEASPGPHDSHYLFERFVGMIGEHKRKAA